MDFKNQSKGKTTSSSSAGSFSFRYNAEEEEVEQLFYESDTNRKADDSFVSSTEDGLSEIKDSSPVLPRSKVLGNLDDGASGETWRILKEMKGRITKTVEEKIEEIKSDRMKKKLLATSSLSDSEERSETSSSVKDWSDKSCQNKEGGVVADSDLADISDVSLTPERTTPILTEVDISDVTPSKDSNQSTFSTPTKTACSAASQETERSASIFYKKLKMKVSKKIEMGVEAIEVSIGKEEGRLAEKISAAGSKDNNSGATTYLMPTISTRAATYCLLLAVLYMFVNVPQFLCGVIVGAFLSFEFSLWTNCTRWIGPQTGPNEFMCNNYPSEQLTSPSMTERQKILYEGWMNEFCFEYQPEIYQVTQTETVYVRLEDSTLRLASPRQKISKRALWNEPHYKQKFDRERTYDISGCEVLLLPDKLAHKRLWSKKYPICIILKPDSHLGTRYRERGTSSLDLVSFKKFPIKAEGEDKTEEEQDFSEEKTTIKVKKDGVSLDDEDMLICSEEEDEEDWLSSDYVKVPTSLINKNNIYLFARTDREKDIWFRRLASAVKLQSPESEEEDQKTDTSLLESEDEIADKKPQNMAEHYETFIAQFIKKKMSFCTPEDSVDEPEEEDSLAWLNIFLARILYDPMHDGYWIKQIQDKIQKKLSAIKVPTFMEELLVSQIELSESVPVIEKSCLPKLNCDGVWVDLDISYKGTFKMSIDTKINLIKLKNYYGAISTTEGQQASEKSFCKSAIFDSEMEDSAESSGDDVCPEDSKKNTISRRKTSQKVLQMVDKIASSKYFQQVTDNKYVKKALEGVSNTTISLVVHVKSLTGTVVINFPPPPSDRLWYGFRPNTKLLLSAKPKVGQRGINMVYITNYIEKKLVKEFEKLLVMPNMDDLIIPLMNKDKPC